MVMSEQGWPTLCEVKKKYQRPKKNHLLMLMTILSGFDYRGAFSQ